MKWEIEATHGKTGDEVRGTLEAKSEADALRQMQLNGYLVSSIRAKQKTIVRRPSAEVVDIPSGPPPLPIQRSVSECPACRGMVSLAAPTCPHCGHPLRAAPPAPPV